MKLASIIMITLGLAIGGMFMASCSALGTRPGKEQVARLSLSKNYDKQDKIFVNRRPKIIQESRKEGFSFGTLVAWFSEGVDRVPSKPLPEIKPDIQEFLKPSETIKVVWFGHSTFLLNLEGMIILVDPIFSGSASPFSFMVKRFQPPVLGLSELPPIDYILISHDHYDHLDAESIKFFKDKKVQFIAPLGVSSHLIGWGVHESKIVELDWWQSHIAKGVEFIATPAQHFSGRDGFNNNETLWASWVIKSEKHNIYFSGDSGYDTHFKEIGDKYGPFDIAFIENGQYDEKWKAVHLLPDESVQAYFDLKAKRYFPVHWGMFDLAFHTWYEPIVKIEQASIEKGVNLVCPRIGEIIEVNDTYQLENWWVSLINK